MKKKFKFILLASNIILGCNIITLVCVFLPNVTLPGAFEDRTYTYFELFIPDKPSGLRSTWELEDFGPYIMSFVLLAGYVVLFYALVSYIFRLYKKDYYKAYSRFSFYSLFGFIYSIIIPSLTAYGLLLVDPNDYYVSAYVHPPTMRIGLALQVLSSATGIVFCILSEIKMWKFNKELFNEYANETSKTIVSNSNEISSTSFENSDTQNNLVNNRLVTESKTGDEEITEKLIDD